MYRNNKPFRKGLKFSFELSLLELGAETVVEVPVEEEEEGGEGGCFCMFHRYYFMA